MAYPNFNDSFILHTDASEMGLGAVLYQRESGQLRVIICGLPKLTLAEKNYPSTFMKTRIPGIKMGSV